MPRPTSPPSGSVQDLSGEWTLATADGRTCRLTLSVQEVEPRAAGSLPPPMMAAREDGNCGLGRRIGGWRFGAQGSVELVDAYGLTLARLHRTGESFGGEEGVTLRPCSC